MTRKSPNRRYVTPLKTVYALTTHTHTTGRQTAGKLASGSPAHRPQTRPERSYDLSLSILYAYLNADDYHVHTISKMVSGRL